MVEREARHPVNVFRLQAGVFDRVVSALVVEAIGLVVLMAGVLWSGRVPTWTLAALPIIPVLQFVFTAGVAWMLSTITVFVPDVRPAVSLGLTLWMFMTPIMYPATMVPERFRWLLALNPMSYVVDAYRGVVIDNRWPDAASIGVSTAIALSAFMIGHWAFSRSQSFADFL